MHMPCKKTKEIAFKQELDIDTTFSLGNNFTHQLVIKRTSLNICTKISEMNIYIYFFSQFEKPSVKITTKVQVKQNKTI